MDETRTVWVANTDCDLSKVGLDPVSERERCSFCDDTGDVHAIDGQWRGVCTCAAGEPGDVQEIANKESATR